MEVRILRAKDVEIPLKPKEEESEAITNLRSKFFAGDDLSSNDLKRLVLESVARAGNGDCNVC